MSADSDAGARDGFFHAVVHFLDFVDGGAETDGYVFPCVVFLDDIVDAFLGGFFMVAFVGFVGEVVVLAFGGGDAEVGFVEVEFFCAEGVGFEIEDPLGVEGLVLESNLEMEVRSGGAAGASAKAEDVAGLDDLLGFDFDFGEMAVDGFEAVVVANHHEVAIGAHGTGNSNDAGEDAMDGVAGVEGDVDATVWAVPAPAVGGGDDVLDGEAELVVFFDESDVYLSRVAKYCDSCFRRRKNL